MKAAVVRNEIEFSAEERLLLDEAKYLFGDLAPILGPVIRVQREFERWEKQDHKRGWSLAKAETGRRPDGVPIWGRYLLAGLVRKLGPSAICPGSLASRIAVLQELYVEAGSSHAGAAGPGIRRRIVDLMEAIGRALVTRTGSPTGKTKGKPKPGRPRKPDSELTVSGTEKRIARDGGGKRKK